MNETEQRIAIAEACGLTVCKHNPDKWERRGTEGDSELYCTECKKNLSDMRVPEYLHDLNAMHEAEEWLNKHDAEKACAYDLEWLPKVVEAIDQPSGLVNTMRLFHATAAQRAEAFLKTVGKWKD